DRDQRAIERQRDGVPGVRVLCAAVDQHELGVAGAPHERAHPTARAVDDDLFAPDDGASPPRDAELLGILVEQAELVIVHRVDRTHAAAAPSGPPPLAAHPATAAYARRVRLPLLSPLAFRRLALVAAILLAVIIVTGGAVRVTGSGLGCPDWP